MKRTDEVFNREMERATRMQNAGMEGYWSGYAAGLMRARFGPVAVGDSYHEAWSPCDAPGARARGYRDGYAKLVAPGPPEPAAIVRAL